MSVKIDLSDPRISTYQVKESDLMSDGFESNVDEFTTYYHMDCLMDVREKLTRMYLLKLDGQTVGYVTLAMTHVEHDATEDIKAKGINGDVPALLISHLAVHKDFQRRGIGTALLDLVFNIVPDLESRAGCRYVMLNPRDDQGVRDFYAKYGFVYWPNMDDDKTSDLFLMDLKSNKLDV